MVRVVLVRVPILHVLLLLKPGRRRTLSPAERAYRSETVPSACKGLLRVLLREYQELTLR